MKTTTFTVSGSHSFDAGNEITIVVGNKSKRFVVTEVNDASTVTIKKVSWWTTFVRKAKAMWGSVIDWLIKVLNQMKPVDDVQSKIGGFPYLTVGDLKIKIQKLPNEMPVLYERIEDEYFAHGWETIKLKTGEVYTLTKDVNGKKIYEDQYGEFIEAFTGYEIDGKFVITAHY